VQGPGAAPDLTSRLLARAQMVKMGRDAAPSSGNVPYPAAAQHPPRTYRHLTGMPSGQRPAERPGRPHSSSQQPSGSRFALELSIKDEGLILSAGIVSPAYRGRDAGRAVWRRMLGVQKQLLAGTQFYR
jgi:hypothetical protein